MASTEDTFNPAALSRSDTVASTVTVGKNAASSTPKQAKPAQTFSRIDFEPLYVDLKDALGHKWDTYYEAITRFIRGELHAREFGYLCDDVLYANDNVLHLHNKFVCAVAFNSARDNPEPGVATWVTAASDKSGATSSNKAAITSDAGEQRLKKEVMAIPARDRRRVKGAQTDKAEEEAQSSRRNQYEESYQASRIRAPEAAPQSAGGLTKTNWELEIRKRYQQPLVVESSEFPEAAAIYARMVPICYEESIPQGASMQSAELVATSAEFYLKDFLGTVFNRVRSNGPRYENGAGGGIMTSGLKKQMEKELDLVKEGKLQRNRDDDLLPAESHMTKTRRPLGLNDFKLANHVGPTLWNRSPLIGFDVENNTTENDYEDWRADKEQAALLNGHSGRNEDDMEVDEEDDGDDFDWDGEGFGNRGILDSLIDGCLTASAA